MHEEGKGKNAVGSRGGIMCYSCFLFFFHRRRRRHRHRHAPQSALPTCLPPPHSLSFLVLEVVELHQGPQGHKPLLQLHLVSGLEVEPALPPPRGATNTPHPNDGANDMKPKITCYAWPILRFRETWEFNTVRRM